MVIRKLDSTEIDLFESLIRLFEGVFEMENFKMPTRAHLAALLQKEDFIAYVAVRDQKVIGGLTAYLLQQYYSEKPQAYIYDLAVGTELQGQGIGSAIIKSFCDYSQSQGFEEVFVQADQDEPEVIDFYRKTKPNGEEEVIHFTYEL